jgi:hypothetical protein
MLVKVKAAAVRVSLCDVSRAQVLVSEPSASFITQLPQLCPSAVMGRLVVCDESWVEVPVSTPAVVQVAGVVTVY